MLKVTVPVYSHTGDIETARVIDGDNTIIAGIDPDGGSMMDTPDCCGCVSIHMHDVYTPRIHTNCKFCEEHSGTAERLLEAWNTADDAGWNTRTDDTPAEAMFKAMTRAGARVSTLTDRKYEWYAGVVTSPEDIESAEYLIVNTDDYPEGGNEGIAREWAAYLNGYVWVVGVSPTKDVDETTLPWDCEDVVHGYVWDNADRTGYSSPTEEDLTNAF